jgi:hypothetical protein
MKLFFEIEAGLFNRGSIRTQLNNSKAKLQYWYPGCRVLITEDKNLLESKFYFEANDLPDSAKPHMEKWLSDMKKIAENY